MVQTALVSAASTRPQPFAATPPRPAAEVAPVVRAELTVHYMRSPPEHRRVELRPWGERSQLMAQCRGPREHESETRLLPVVHDPRRATAVEALRCLSVLYFGPTGLLPRILGEPDWCEASLQLMTEGDDADAPPLLLVQLKVEGRMGLRALVRNGQAGTELPTPTSMSMRPGDADPLHALLRVGFGHAPWPMPT